MMVAPKQIQAALLPAVAKDKKALADDFVRFVLAGLDDRCRVSFRLMNAERAGRWIEDADVAG